MRGRCPRLCLTDAVFRILLALALACPAGALAQPYPSKPVRLIVPYPAGTTPDIIGRALAERLQVSLGQPFVVENRSGAGGNIGAEAVAKAGDPHVLLIGGNGPVAINKHLYKALSYDPDRDLVPILAARVGAADARRAKRAARRGLQGLRRARTEESRPPVLRVCRRRQRLAP